MEKINKEELLEITGLSEEDLNTVAGGEVDIVCLRSVSAVRIRCLTSCESVRNQPVVYAKKLMACEQQYKQDLMKCGDPDGSYAVPLDDHI